MGLLAPSLVEWRMTELDEPAAGMNGNQRYCSMVAVLLFGVWNGIINLEGTEVVCF